MEYFAARRPGPEDFQSVGTATLVKPCNPAAASLKRNLARASAIGAFACRNTAMVGVALCQLREVMTGACDGLNQQ